MQINRHIDQGPEMSKLDQIPDPSPKSGLISITREAEQDAPEFIAVIGLHQSGASEVAMVLHELGVHMGRHLGGYERSEWGEAVGLAAICDEIAPFPTTGITNSPLGIEQKLRTWISQRRMDALAAKTIAGGKCPNLCALLPTLRNICGSRLKIIDCDRPLKESVIALRRTARHCADTGKPIDDSQAEAVQTWLWREKSNSLKELPHIAVRYDELFRNPRACIQKLAEYTGRQPDEATISRCIKLLGSDRNQVVPASQEEESEGRDHSEFVHKSVKASSCSHASAKKVYNLTFNRNPGGSPCHYYHFLFGVCVPLHAWFRKHADLDAWCLPSLGPMERHLRSIPSLSRVQLLQPGELPLEYCQETIKGMDFGFAGSYQIEPIKAFRQEILGGEPDGSAIDILFIDRGYPRADHLSRFKIKSEGAMRRNISNSTSICQELRLDGWTVEHAFLEDLTLQQQARLVHRAKIIIAQHGAGLSNLVFAQPAASVVEVGPRNRRHYKDLCDVLQLNYLVYPSQSDYVTLNCSDLRRLIETCTTG